MKVDEKGTDRTAEVHLFPSGSTDALDEYGEYVDPVDKAICCFVPVAVGDEIRVDGRFKGMTISIHCDVSVDGVCRKADHFSGKAVKKQSRSISFDKFYYKTTDEKTGDIGIIDSALVVKEFPSDCQIDENAPATIGTIEVRVCVLRRFGDHHKWSGLKYYNCEDEGHNTEKPVGYKSIAPEFAITIEEKLPFVESRKINLQKRSIDADRPGCEPWTIFRFHYRSSQSIVDAHLTKSFWHGMKKAPGKYLDVEKLPPLALNSAPPKAGDGEESTRQSSTAPSKAGSMAPARGARSLGTPSAKPTSTSRQRSQSLASDGTIEDTIELDQADTKSSSKTMAPPKAPASMGEGDKPGDSLFIPEGGDLEETESTEFANMFIKGQGKKTEVAKDNGPANDVPNSTPSADEGSGPKQVNPPVEESSTPVEKEVTAPVAVTEVSEDKEAVTATRIDSTEPLKLTTHEADNNAHAKEVDKKHELPSTPPLHGTTIVDMEADEELGTSVTPSRKVQESLLLRRSVTHTPEKLTVTSEKEAGTSTTPENEPETAKPVKNEALIPTHTEQELDTSQSRQEEPKKPTTPEPAAQKAPQMPITPITPTKRANDLTAPDTPTIAIKRLKIDSPAAVEHRILMEKRRELAQLKKEHEELALKRKEAAARAAPYLQRMAKQRAEVEAEIAAERAAIAQEAEEWQTEEELLKGFEAEDRMDTE